MSFPEPISCSEPGSPAQRAPITEPFAATDAIFRCPVRRENHSAPVLVGVLPGEGIGREVTDAALDVLRAVGRRFGIGFAFEFGGPIGLPAIEATGQCLSDEVAGFCCSVFERGGAILAGAGGGRFVYDFRRRFDLFCKLNPVVAWPEMDDARIVKGEIARAVDFLVVRENLNGLYQGTASEVPENDGSPALEHRFTQPESTLRRFLETAARIARLRRGRLDVIYKAGGLPELAAFWKRLAEEAAAVESVECRCLDVDYACYLVLQEPKRFDVIAAPNCFADILSDLGGLLMGGRGLTFGASFGSNGEAVYQTNHGAAYDLQGTGRGNPIGQILSAAMMLRESFGLADEAAAAERAVRKVLGQGFRTGDIATPASTVVGTAEMTDRIAAEITNGS